MAIYLVAMGDRTDIWSAQGLPEVVWQPDTFHAIAHRLGIRVERFEKSAYQAMQEEYDCQATFNSAVSDGVIARRIEKHDELVEQLSEILHCTNSLSICIPALSRSWKFLMPMAILVNVRMLKRI